MSESVVKAVVGLRRYGKSSHVVNMTRGCRRIIFFDSLNDDYNQGIVCRDWPTLLRVWRASYQGDFRLTFKPVNPLDSFSRFCGLAYECGGCTVVIDEVQLYFRGFHCDPAFAKLITAGGHVDVELIGVTQAPKRLGELLRSQAHEWHIFALREETHVRYVEDRCPGVDPDLIRLLPKYEYLHFVDGAEHYWRCRDILTTGRTIREVVAYERTDLEEKPSPGETELSGDSLGGRSENDSACV